MLSRLTAPLSDEAFTARFKQSPKDFTRIRVLTFRTVVVLLMAKGMKSLQLSLNEIIPKLSNTANRTVSKVAYSKARRKLKHTAFIELNRQAVVRTMYEDGDHQVLHGFRILAIDGSKVQLPTNEETVSVFGSFAYRNGRDDTQGEHSYALASVLYDVLNHVALDARLTPARSYEVDIAKEHLRYTENTDLVIYDRGYCSFRMLALASQAPGHFLIRGHNQSFKAVNDMLAGECADDMTVELHAPQKFKANKQNDSLPRTLTVRLVRVTLDTGEHEVLLTSLLDSTQYPLSIFKELYWLRWGVETFYGVLKTRLGLENFSGLSVEAVRQDFHIAVLLTGVESILTEEAEIQLKAQTGGIPKKVNKAVSFNAIKYRAFELFYSDKPPDEVLASLTELFTQSPTLIRKGRNPPRSTSSNRQKLGFWKRKRKVVF